MNPFRFRKSHFTLSQINTLRCQQKELEQRSRKVHHDACYVAAVVGGEKARLRMKRH